MNKNLRKAMISAICMLIVGVMSLTGVTYAWFTSTQTAQVKGIDVSIVSTEGGIMLDAGDEDWTFTLEAEDTNNNVTKKQPVSAAKILTSDDKLTFFTATVDDANNAAVITSKLDVDDDNGYVGGNYYVTDFRMKNPNATTATVSLSGSVETLKNNVKSAVRWAIVDKDNNTVYFFAGHSSDNKGDTDEDYLAVKAAATSFDSTVAGDNVEWVALNELNDFSAVVEPVEYNEDGTEKANHARSFALYAWLEGNDSDCTNSLAGSAFSINVSFNTTLAEE